MRWIVVVLALVEGGWLAYDGSRALIVGDYVTPKEGRHAGQLGPWAHVVAAVGIKPRSTVMKAVHVSLGVPWLIVTTCFALQVPWSWAGMLICAVLGLWYLPFGTILSLAQIALLMLLSLRGSAP